MHVLTLNSGSSSIKFALIDPASGKTSLEGIVENIGSDAKITCDGKEEPLSSNDYRGGIEAIAKVLGTPELLGVGHRVVHGGEQFTDSVIIDSDVLEAIRSCIDLAPLHNPANILGIETAQALFPNTPQVAVFDTAFHQSMPKHAYLYALPYELYERFRIRRYGFHGISHKYVTELAAREYDASLCISCHLGNGCSLAAVRDGKSLDTTMGMTPLEGLVMGTRSGDIDPGIFGYLSDTMEAKDIVDMLNRESGLLGISGESMDMRTLEASNNERAGLAIDIFCYRLAKSIMAMSVALGDVDAVIFTGGIGENSKRVRKQVIDLLPGYEYEEQDSILTTAESNLAVVIPTNEALMIAQETVRLL